MKTGWNISIAAGLIAILFACNNPTNTSTLEVEPTAGGLVKDRDTVAIKDNDSIAIHNYQLVFNTADSIAIPDFLDQHGIKLSGGQMAYFTSYKHGLGLHLANGDTTVLQNDTSGAREYHFFAHMPGINHHLVRVQYPEGNSYLLVNARNGKKAELIGLPYVSPSKKYIIAINQDLIAGHSPNAIQLLKIENDSLAHQFTLDVKGWGPEKIKWLSDSSFIVQKKTAIENSAKSRIDESTSYARVRIQER